MIEILKREEDDLSGSEFERPKLKAEISLTKQTRVWRWDNRNDRAALIINLGAFIKATITAQFLEASESLSRPRHQYIGKLKLAERNSRSARIANKETNFISDNFCIGSRPR